MISLDMMLYYGKVRDCCCFKDSISREYNNIMQKAITFNHVLNKENRITDQDNAQFIEFFKEYRNWLLERFMNPHYSFSAEYPDLYSRKKRKLWNVAAFESIFGGASREELFFAQTFNDFSVEALKYNNNDRLVAHKMRLGAIMMLVTIGYHLEYAVSNEEAIIHELQNKEHAG